MSICISLIGCNGLDSWEAPSRNRNILPANAIAFVKYDTRKLRLISISDKICSGIGSGVNAMETMRCLIAYRRYWTAFIGSPYVLLFSHWENPYRIRRARATTRPHSNPIIPPGKYPIAIVFWSYLHGVVCTGYLCCEHCDVLILVTLSDFFCTVGSGDCSCARVA